VQSIALTQSYAATLKFTARALR